VVGSYPTVSRATREHHTAPARRDTVPGVSDQQPPYPPQGYPQQGYQPGYPPYAAPPTSSRATTSLVLGIISLLLCGFLLGIPAMIVARRAKREIRESGGRLGGDGLATAGFVTGLIGTIWSALSALVVVAVFVFGGVVTSSFEQSCDTVQDGSGGVSVECG
jgi:hypothetical protein